MLAAVSGASGFIGSAVVRALLAEGRPVRALIEPGARTTALDDLPSGSVERVTVDVCDRKGMTEALRGAASYFHLAAIYRIWNPDPSIIYRVNLEGTTASMLAAQDAKVARVVYTSSIAAVGLRGDGRPSDETEPFNLYDIANEYILTKYLSERIAMRFAETMPIVVVNPAFPFGPRDLAPTPTGKILLSLLKGEMPGVSEGGFCAIDVEDVAFGHLAAEKLGRVGERYILGDHNVTFREFFELVGEVANVKVPKLPIPSALAQGIGMGMELWAKKVSHAEPRATKKAIEYMQKLAFFDASKSRRELGLKSRPLAGSIDRAVRYFREHGMA
jgi:dihydroflavonol-4-reductase